MSNFHDILVTEMERKSGGEQWGRGEWAFNEYPLAHLNVSSTVLPPGKCLSTVHPITILAAHVAWRWREAECVCKKALLCNIMRSRWVICRDCWSSGQTWRKKKNSAEWKDHVKQEMAYNEPGNHISDSQGAGISSCPCLLAAKHFLLLCFLSLSTPLISALCLENMNELASLPFEESKNETFFHYSTEVFA